MSTLQSFQPQISCSDYVRQRSRGATIRQKTHIGDIAVTFMRSKVKCRLRGLFDWRLRDFLDVVCGGVTGAELWEVQWRVQGLERRSGWTDLCSDKVSVSLSFSFSRPQDLFVHAAHQAKMCGFPPHQWPPLSKGLGGLEQCTFAVENKKKKLRWRFRAICCCNMCGTSIYNFSETIMFGNIIACFPAYSLFPLILKKVIHTASSLEARGHIDSPFSNSSISCASVLCREHTLSMWSSVRQQ